ncbi:hypothetical protein TNCV_1091971 [Trichonephila clavipes]|nr:hypothetical protein TNCV_1091971 [Trichonephila clavipes]
MQGTVRFGNASNSILREDTWGCSGAFHLSTPSTNQREDLRLDRYFEDHCAAKALYIYKHPCLFRVSNPVPTAPESASLTTIPDGRLKHHFISLCLCERYERLQRKRLHLRTYFAIKL